MKRKIIILMLLNIALCACASNQANNAYTPASNFSTQPKVQKDIPLIASEKITPMKMQKLSRHHLTGIAAVKAANKKALRRPNSNEYVNATMTFNYIDGALYQIYCAPLNITDIQLAPDEHVVSIAAGDTLRWQVSKTYSGGGSDRCEHILIKPVGSNIENTLVITTDQRTYHLMLHSTDKTYMASVEWQYPESQDFVEHFAQNASQQTSTLSNLNVDLQNLDFDYQMSMVRGTQPDWTPKRVFNDGQKTYIQFPDNVQELPTLFVGNSVEDSQLVNYRVQGNFYIVDQVLKNAQLRSGQSSFTIIEIRHK